MNRNETKLIVENWRNYLNEDKNKQINEIDLSSLQEYIPQVTTASIAVGAAMGAGSLLIRQIYKKFVHKFITRGQNKEAFLKFIDLLNIVFDRDRDGGYVWEKFEKINNHDIDNWIGSGQETIANAFKDPFPQKMEKYRKKENAKRLNLYARNIKALMSYWNPKVAIKAFDDIIQNNNKHEFKKIFTIVVNIYETYESEYENNNEYMDEEQFVLDAAFEAMLHYFKMYHSKLAKNTAKGIKKLQNEFGNQISVETTDSGEVTITADKNADIECVLTLADASANFFMKDRDFYSTDQIKVSIRVDEDIRDEFYDRRDKSISLSQKLETLKKILVFAKNVVGASAVSGPIAFIKAFVKSFTKDEVLGKIADELQNKVDSKKIDDSSDFKTNEFIKFIIAICLE